MEDLSSNKIVLVVNGDINTTEPDPDHSWNIIIDPESALTVARDMKLLALKMLESRSMNSFNPDKIKNILGKE